MSRVGGVEWVGKQGLSGVHEEPSLGLTVGKH